MLVEKQSEIEQRLGVPLNAIAMFWRRWNIATHLNPEIRRFQVEPGSETNLV